MFDFRQHSPTPEQIDTAFNQLTAQRLQTPTPQETGLSHYHRVLKHRLAHGDIERDAKITSHFCREMEIKFIEQVARAKQAHPECNEVLKPFFTHRFLYSDGASSISHSLGELRDVHGRSVVLHGGGFEVVSRGCVLFLISSHGVSNGSLPWYILDRAAGESVMETFFETPWRSAKDIYSRSFIYSNIVSYLNALYGKQIRDIVNLGVKGSYATPSMDIKVSYADDASKVDVKLISKFRVAAAWDEEQKAVKVNMQTVSPAQV